MIKLDIIPQMIYNMSMSVLTIIVCFLRYNYVFFTSEYTLAILMKCTYLNTGISLLTSFYITQFITNHQW